MNFTVYHGPRENRHILTEADNFDNLASVLSVYRKLDYSNITIYHPLEKGIEINNLPDFTAKQTGFMKFDIYGCWYEIEPDKDFGPNMWMIGEYPYQY